MYTHNICVYTHLYVCAYTHVCVYTDVCVRVYVCVCMHTYTYIKAFEKLWLNIEFNDSLIT